MADLALALTTPSTALNTNAAAATFLQIAAAAQQRVTVNELSVSFAGTSNTQAEVLADVAQQTSAGTGMTANNPGKWDIDFPETVQSTGNRGFAQSAEPAGTVLVWEEFIHPQTGLLWQAPFAMEFKCPGGKMLGLRVNNSAALNGICRMRPLE
jgi:hypothetical protein